MPVGPRSARAADQAARASGPALPLRGRPAVRNIARSARRDTRSASRALKSPVWAAVKSARASTGSVPMNTMRSCGAGRVGA